MAASAEVSGLSDEAAYGACSEPDASTKDFLFQQTMLRVKDPKKSLDFLYKSSWNDRWLMTNSARKRTRQWKLETKSKLCLIKTLFYFGEDCREAEVLQLRDVFMLRLLQKFDFPAMKFSLYFLAYEDKNDIPKDKAERTAWTFSRKATLELTHNWGTENDENQSYHNGNSDPRGFGHIGIAVPDVNKACKRFEELGVKFVKKPDDGKMKGLAFVQDPDGYWIEILNPNHMVTLT